MKRKSIYKILWRAVGFCLVWWLINTAGAGTAIVAYIVFCAGADGASHAHHGEFEGGDAFAQSRPGTVVTAVRPHPGLVDNVLDGLSNER